MKEKLVAAKSAIAAMMTAAAAFLGWKGILLFAWVGVMALDYLSGTVAAALNGQWSSAVAREGLKHKGGMILVVTVAAIADAVMIIIVEHVPIGIQWPGLILPMVLSWYIITELGSILENAVLLGAPVPSWLVSMLKASANIVETAGDLAVMDKNPADADYEKVNE